MLPESRSGSSFVRWRENEENREEEPEARGENEDHDWVRSGTGSAPQGCKGESDVCGLLISGPTTTKRRRLKLTLRGGVRQIKKLVGLISKVYFFLASDLSCKSLQG